jgi:DNA polymerase-3 subunit delta'
MISAGTHPDRLELESGENHVSIKVDDVRLLSTFSQRSSHSGAARIAIIPEAHRMNSSASNALLKTLEEPQDQVYIILTSSEFGRLSATVRSRVQRIKMRSPSLQETTDFLSDELEEEGVLEFLRLSRGKTFIDGPEFSRQELSHYRDFQRCVLDTLFFKKSSYELQKCAFNLKPHSAIDEFFLIASEILKRNFIEQEGDIEKPCVSKEDISNIRSKQNSALEKAEFSENLATFISFVESAQKVMKSSSNPNPQLLLDSLIWRWERLGSSLEKRNIN